jgi:hypothetical protein
MIAVVDRRSRVVVAVDPRLLASALARALEHMGAEVIDLTAPAPEVGDSPADDETGRAFDIGLVGGGGGIPAWLDVAVTIRLPDAPGEPGWAITPYGGVEPVEISSLDTIFDLVARISGCELRDSS